MKTQALPLSDVLGHEASDKRIDILRRIAQVGSISEAARGAGVSYKAGWQALETLANLAGTPLVEKVVGGSGGGGAVLTAAGQKVLLAADAMAQARQEVLQLIDRGDEATGRAAFALRTSMRNQFPCTVGAVKSHQGQVRVQLHLADGSAVYSRITRESMQLLGLRPGLAVLALCKATAVQVVPSAGDVKGKNTLVGVVTRATRSAKGGEVSLRLPGGVQLVGFSSGPSPKVGQSTTAQIDEAGMVIAALD
jgi:molybdate transport system regulatory protein